MERKAKNTITISEQEFTVSAESVIDFLNNKPGKSGIKDFWNTYRAIKEYILAELKKLDVVIADPEEAFFRELLNNSYDAYNASEERAKGHPLKIKIIFSRLDDFVVMK